MAPSSSCCSCCSQSSLPACWKCLSSLWCGRCCFINPTLGLLDVSDFVFTVNHSGLWQRHIAWAKPKGQELRSYISSQYSTNMVLLSLLLGIQINVFFNSSPELVDLRQRLLSTGGPWLFHTATTGGYNSMKYWIGFILLLNICVTIMGILATFSSWSMISAISDRNAHCLLRSSIGQYVTTLPPRLVVASLYMFLLWFLLFVIDLVAFGPLLWSLLILVAVMFLAIVIPLSAFGRLILHTGAMAQKPVLSEELERELLPTGLHASLVIRAHHRQRRNTSVTHQYRQRHQQQQHESRMGRAQVGNHGHDDVNDDDVTPSHSNTASAGINKNIKTDSTAIGGLDDPVHIQTTNSESTMFASDDENEDDNVNGSLVYTESGCLEQPHLPQTAMKNDGLSKKDRHRQDKKLRNGVLSTSPPTATTAHHRRIQTGDTTLFLPPAAILNMSLSGKEFKELIDNTIDTSSLGHNAGTSPDVFRQPAASPSNNNDSIHKSSKTASIPAPSALITTSTSTSVDIGVPPTYPVPQSESNYNNYDHSASKHSPTNSRPDAITKQHRRVSSSRFLLNEWARESSVRELYGVALPADLPQEITLLEQHQTVATEQQDYADQWSPRRIRNRSNRDYVNSNNNHSLSMSPFSPDNNDVHYQGKKSDQDIIDQEQKQLLHSLTQPLLPSLDGDYNDEEIGDSLLGEEFLPSEGQRRKNLPTSNRTPRRGERKKR